MYIYDITFIFNKYIHFIYSNEMCHFECQLVYIYKYISLNRLPELRAEFEILNQSLISLQISFDRRSTINSVCPSNQSPTGPSTKLTSSPIANDVNQFQSVRT